MPLADMIITDINAMTPPGHGEYTLGNELILKTSPPSPTRTFPHLRIPSFRSQRRRREHRGARRLHFRQLGTVRQVQLLPPAVGVREYASLTGLPMNYFERRNGGVGGNILRIAEVLQSRGFMAVRGAGEDGVGLVLTLSSTDTRIPIYMPHHFVGMFFRATAID